MGADIDGSPQRPPDQYDALISALEALGAEESVIHFDFVKARVMQEEQRIPMRSEAALEKSETSALFSRHYENPEKSSSFKPRPRCGHCKRIGHIEDKCRKKFPHLNPQKSEKPKSNVAFVAAQLVDSNTPEEQIVRLMANYITHNTPKNEATGFSTRDAANI